MRGRPIAGDFDGDGATDLGAYVSGIGQNMFYFDLAYDGLDGQIDDQFRFDFNGVNEQPFAGDFNLDGIDDVGLVVPDQDGVSPGIAEWYVKISQGAAVRGRVEPLKHAFSPVPVGEDLFFEFGSNVATPLVGNFDPPLPGSNDSVPFAEVDGNTLRITGTAGADKIETFESDQSITVVVNGESASFPADDVRVVSINSGTGNDEIVRSGTTRRKANISAGAGNDIVFGGIGRDNILGGGGEDILHGGAGRDVIRGGGQDDLLVGGPGRDQINAGSGDDTVRGDAGIDAIYAGAGHDVISGGANDDIIYGGSGNDWLDAGAGNDSLYGGRGNDSLFGNSGRDQIRAGSGRDFVDGGVGADSLDGGTGHDVVRGGNNDDSVTGGSGRDILIGDGGADTLDGTVGDDVMVGGGVTLDSSQLRSIASEWLRGRKYDLRIANIRSGSGNSSYRNNAFLSQSSVADDEAADTLLSGEGDNDWFFASAIDSLVNREPFEELDVM